MADNVVYGGFALATGTPIFPGQSYSFNFNLPPLPEPDVYEIDTGIDQLFNISVDAYGGLGDHGRLVEYILEIGY